MPSTDEPGAKPDDVPAAGAGPGDTAVTGEKPGETPVTGDASGTATEPDANPDPAARAASRRKAVLISAAVVVVLAAVGLVVYLVARDDSPDTAAGDPGVPTIEGSAPPGASEAPPAGSTPPSMSLSSTPPAPAGGPDAGEAQSVAEQAATAISNADTEALVQLSCDPDSVGADDTLPENAKVEVVGEPVVAGDTATVNVRVTVPGAEPAEVPMPLIKQDGRWCIPS